MKEVAIPVQDGTLIVSWWRAGIHRNLLVEHESLADEWTRGILLTGNEAGWWVNHIRGEFYGTIQEALQSSIWLQVDDLHRQFGLELQLRREGLEPGHLLDGLEDGLMLRRFRLYWLPRLLVCLEGMDPFELEGAHA